MARNYVINGPTLVKVNGSIGSGLADRELGLADSGVVIEPRFYHQDIHTDDFGPSAPPEVMFMLAEVRISMTLVHFDQNALRHCLNEAMAGGSEGTLVGCGTLMGGGKALGDAANHYVSLLLTSPTLDEPWQFPACYLAEQPCSFPLGVEKSIVRLTWRAVPYYVSAAGSAGGGGAVVDVVSAGTVLWNHNGSF